MTRQKTLRSGFVGLITILSPALCIAQPPVNAKKPVAKQGPIKVSDKQILAEIRNLASSSYRKRVAAEKALRKFGVAAEKHLQKAAASGDPEVSRRAKAILADIEEKRFLAQANKLGFHRILERIHKHASSNKWRTAGWKDPGLEAALKTFILQVKRATGNDNVALPVKFANVQPGGNPDRSASGKLYILKETKGAQISSARNCIFLVDGSIRISSAYNCIIIARTAVDISSGRNNVVLAGHYIRSTFSSTRRGSPEILMSGGVVHLSHADNAIISAPRQVRVSIARNTTFVNSPNVRASIDRQNKRVNDAKILLAPKAMKGKNPLSDLKVTQVIGSGAKSFVIVKQGKVELVLRMGAAITDNTGKPIPKYDGWKLSFVTSGLAVFSKGRQDATFYVQ